MLRLMDANLDRLSEGLRVLEDVARFILGDVSMTESLKQMRHRLTSIPPEFETSLIMARDSGGDVGRDSLVTGTERRYLSDLVAANAKRAQQSLRVLEEFSKLPEVPQEIAGRGFEQARFTLYEIEKQLIYRLSGRERQERINGLYVIIDTGVLNGRNEVEAARQAINGGAGIIQIRDSSMGKADLIATCDMLMQACHEANVLFIVNDHIDVALATGADGVHLGQDDVPLKLARRILPPDKIIGFSARTVELAVRAQEEGADYLGVGSIYPSPAKPEADVIGLSRLREITERVSIPVVAIGGIEEKNAKAPLENGADSIAVISTVLNYDDIEMATRRLATQISGGK